MRWVYYLGRVLIRILVFPLGNWVVQGRENLPARGPLLIVCNHLHLADSPIVASSIKLRSVFMAKEELWQNRWSRFWVENFGAFPVRRGGVDPESFRAAERWIKRGVCVIVFPEGRRSVGGGMQAALPGVALLASRLGVPVLPVGIAGTDKFNNLWWSFLHRPRITVTIGRSFNPPAADGKLTRERRHQLVDTIMRKVADLLPPPYRGVYAGGEGASDSQPGEGRE